MITVFLSLFTLLSVYIYIYIYISFLPPSLNSNYPGARTSRHMIMHAWISLFYKHTYDSFISFLITKQSLTASSYWFLAHTGKWKYIWLHSERCRDELPGPVSTAQALRYPVPALVLSPPPTEWLAPTLLILLGIAVSFPPPSLFSCARWLALSYYLIRTNSMINVDVSIIWCTNISYKHRVYESITAHECCYNLIGKKEERGKWPQWDRLRSHCVTHIPDKILH